jgi:hypothetical protein
MLQSDIVSRTPFGWWENLRLFQRDSATDRGTNNSLHFRICSLLALCSIFNLIKAHTITALHITLYFWFLILWGRIIAVRVVLYHAQQVKIVQWLLSLWFFNTIYLYHLRENIQKVVFSVLPPERCNKQCINFVLQVSARCRNLVPAPLTLSNPIFLSTACSPALIYLSLPFSYKHNRTNTTHNHLFTSKHMACQETERVQPALSVGQNPYYMRKSVGQAPTAEREQQNVSDIFQHRSGTGKS